MRSFKSLLMLGAMAIASASAWAFDSVTSLPKGQDTKTSYMLMTPRGTLLADNSLYSNCLVSTLKFKNQTASKTDKRFQFLLFQSKKETSGYYLYNVSAGKFVGEQSGNNVNLSDSPAVWYIFENGQSFVGKSDDVGGTFNSVDWPWCVSSIDGEINNGAIAVSEWQSDTGTRTSGTSWDGGNHYKVVEAEAVPEATWKVAYDKVVAFEANVTPDPEPGTDVDLDPTKVLSPEDQKTQQAAALDIINRFTGGTMDVEVILDLCRTTNDCGRYTYSATADKLTIHATGAVAACRGFYDYVKAKGAGICSWSGNRFVKPADMTSPEVSLVTQFRDHQYFNVVTYGYTMPYWGKERWRQELDWMAFHGIDMPLMLVGSEAIYRKVFVEDFGLTEKDVDEWEVGPAHLPWFRMGNLAGNTFDGPLGAEWNENQRELAHYLLKEMRALGMKPVCPAFGGFVPKAFSKTGTTPEAMGWGWCKPGQRNVPNYRLDPGNSAFAEVGKAFMKRWEEEYGVGEYYLSDSFNEMDIPDAATLTRFGNNIFSIIESSQNPNSVWVTQGWTFCYQYDKWGKAKFEALTKNVPGNRFINLYMSPEYAETYNHPRDFDTTYKGFSGKGWNCTMLPNMGGRSFWTGNLSKYAKGYLEDIYKMADRGNLVGYGLTPEGIENNELLYELICDAGWTQPGGTIDLNNWLVQYSNARYGCYPQQMQDLHAMLRKTVYNVYRDDRRFAWQCALCGGGITDGKGVGAYLNKTFYDGIEKLFSDPQALKDVNTPLLESELIEAAAMYVSGKIDQITVNIKSKSSDKAECARLIGCLEDLMMDFDAALELHPTWNLKRWEDMALACGDKDAKRNAQNARRLLTVWFGQHTSDEYVQDYACRIWGGLVRDYYCPRLLKELQYKCGITKSWDRIGFENAFVKDAPNLSTPRPVTGDHIDFLVKLLDKAKNFGVGGDAEAVEEILASTDKESHWYIIRSAVDGKVLTTQGDNTELVTANETKDSEQIWRVIKTGDDLYRIESRFGQHVSTKGSVARTYLPLLNADVRIAHPEGSESKTIFTIIPKAGHGAFYNNGLWTFEEASPSLVVEASSMDYGRYIRRLAGFDQPELFGKVGQPKSQEALIAGIQALQKEANNIDHKTFGTFLQQWDDVLRQTVTLSDDNDVNRLINLYMSAHQLVVPADAIDGNAATLIAAIEAAEKVVAEGGDAVAAYTKLNTAILAYYNAGGVITDTEVENLVPHTWVFPIGFDESADATRTSDRKLTFIALTEEGQDEQRFDLGYEKVYVNATADAIFTCEPGATLTGNIGYAGNWMHGYFYIDLNHDGKLTYNVDKVEQDGTECVSYSFWSGDLSYEDSGYNSLGESLSGPARNTVSGNKIALPAFKAPSVAGLYNVRFKIDWNSVEPAGSTAQNIIANGGYIVDAVLQVGNPDGLSPLRPMTASLPIFDLQGRRVQKVQKGVFIQNGKKVMK